MKGQRHRILVAERNPHVRVFIGRELSQNNLLVQGARNSDEIFAALESDSPPNLIILDEDTPDTGGTNLLERIVEHTPNILVVLHSYNDEPVSPEMGNHIAGLVQKNGNPEQLVRTVLNILSVMPESPDSADSTSSRE